MLSVMWRVQRTLARDLRFYCIIFCENDKSKKHEKEYYIYSTRIRSFLINNIIFNQIIIIRRLQYTNKNIFQSKSTRREWEWKSLKDEILKIFELISLTREPRKSESKVYIENVTSPSYLASPKLGLFTGQKLGVARERIKLLLCPQSNSVTIWDDNKEFL